MLTRIEISGFKTFEQFALDVPPFLAIIGPNASGKSNLFDALQFLQRLTEANLTVALKEARGEISELFRRKGNGKEADGIRISVEVLLDPRVRDSWGTEVDLTQTRLRYELEIAKQTDAEGNVRLLVRREHVEAIKKSHDTWIKKYTPNQYFMRQYFRDGRRRQPFLETVTEGNRRSFRIRQDGVQGRARPAEAAEATVLSSMNSAEFKHLYALREEIISWSFLQLDPMSLRQPGEKFGDERLETTGSNIARVLRRIQAETATPGSRRGSLEDISRDMGSLIESVDSVDVVENEQTKKWEIIIRSSEEGQYSAGVASDGTLRILALLTSLYDPKYRGLICFEEPENGVHPLRLRVLLQYLKELVTDVTTVDAESDLGLAQVMLNSHSPVVLKAVRDEEAVVLDSVSIVEGRAGLRTRSRVSRVRQVSRTPEITELIDDLKDLVPLSEVQRFEAAALLEEAL